MHDLDMGPVIQILGEILSYRLSNSMRIYWTFVIREVLVSLKKVRQNHLLTRHSISLFKVVKIKNACCCSGLTQKLFVAM